MGAESLSQVTVRNPDAIEFGTRGYALFIVNDAGIRVVPLPATGALVVGRGSEADVRVADMRMSRQHVRIHVGSPFCIEDLHSVNGTVVSGLPLGPGGSRAFNPGDAIMVGTTTMLIRGHATTHAVPASSDDVAGTHVPRPVETSAVEPVVDGAMRAVLALADRAAASTISVLLLGETGVGKDVIAERIHRASPRAAGPFLRLNCAALSPSLLASELFGHEKGAFTGATAAQPGLLQSASGGTVFFDEVGDLPLDVQAKLLLVLERREVLPVGAIRPRQIDVRFISATNHKLPQDVAQGTFRRDLYHRLNGVTIDVPPLRERLTEIEGLARRFAEEAARSIGRTPPRMTAEVLASLRACSWPGNVRELRMVIERAVLLGPEGGISVRDLAPPASEASPAPGIDAGRGSREPEARKVADALAQCGGNQSRAAKLLGLSRNTLIARIEKYGLARPLRPRGRS
jgi:two-component system response regulator AtoC